jgi:hypothetical protein
MPRATDGPIQALDYRTMRYMVAGQVRLNESGTKAVYDPGRTKESSAYRGVVNVTRIVDAGYGYMEPETRLYLLTEAGAAALAERDAERLAAMSEQQRALQLVVSRRGE